ncbi:MAG TPA: hypothetical protein VF980_13625 [Thermoanaerobaculia bacterium]
MRIGKSLFHFRAEIDLRAIEFAVELNNGFREQIEAVINALDCYLEEPL